MSQIRDEKGWLPATCTCGHDHETHRGEFVAMCLECNCDDHGSQCQNCGAEAVSFARPAFCSKACEAQLVLAERLYVARKATA